MLVTTNIQDRRPIFAKDAYAREAIDSLYRVQDLRPFFLNAFVIMPDHVHFLLLVPSPGSISSIMHSYKRAVSHAIGLGPIWQPRFHLHIVTNTLKAREYIHMNPVKAGFVDCAETYRWSSASGRWDVSPLEII